MDHEVVEIAPPGPPEDPLCRWPAELRAEFEANQFNGQVGNTLVSETDRVRVWHLNLPPGGWLTFHRHVLDYFWTTTTAGIARGYYHDGRIVDVYHYPGETRHFKQTADDHFLHAIENVGETTLVFVTVEFLGASTSPLPVPDSVRLPHRRPPELRKLIT